MLRLVLSIDDSCIGRLDDASLSDQTRMELLIDGFDGKDDFFDDTGEFLNIGSMKGITLDDEGRVIVIEFEGVGNYSGTLHMRWLPPSIQKLDVTEHLFEGVFECALIPEVTKIVFLGWNMLTGSLKLVDLSKVIEVLVLDNNRLSGAVDFINIPESLVALNVASNDFTGEIDLRGIIGTILSDANNAALRIWYGDELPLQSEAFFITLDETKFTGDVRVYDIKKISDPDDIFGVLKVSKLVDVSGRTVNLYKKLHRF